MLATLYKHLGTYILNNSNVQHVDIYDSQYSQERDELVYKKPAVFIEYSDVRSSEDSNLIRKEIELTIHVESPNFGNTAIGSNNINDSLEPIELTERIEHLLLKYSPPTPLSKLTNTRLEIATQSHNHPVHKIICMTSFCFRENC